MKKIGFIVFILSNLFLSGQNLVPNPSFEIYTACPSGDFQIELATPWFSPNTATTSAGSKATYLNTCATDPNLQVPYFNGLDYRQPITGDACAGNLYSYSTGTDYRKYITANLNTTLLNSNYYYISFYIGTALRGFRYATNNIAALISSAIPYNSNPNAVLNYTPQIIKYGNPVLNDTSGWIKIDGIYLANGTENYITIGNFKDDNNTDTVYLGKGYFNAAYYLEDVSVINIATPQWQYRDTSVVIGDSVLIGPAISGLNVNWFTMSNAFIKNAPGIYVKPTTTTSYQATETFNSVVYNHTVTVTVLITKTNEYDKLQNSIKLFPNPSNGNFNLQFDDFKSGDIEVNIIDIAGKTVYKNKFQLSGNKINLDINLENGVYFVEIKNSKSNTIVVKKIIIQK